MGYETIVSFIYWIHRVSYFWTCIRILYIKASAAEYQQHSVDLQVESGEGRGVGRPYPILGGKEVVSDRSLAQGKTFQNWSGKKRKEITVVKKPWQNTVETMSKHSGKRKNELKECY